jgi:hypothetical protein
MKNDKKNKPADKPMNEKGDVKKSNDEKIDQDFPGYPHYPAKDDIMQQDERVKLSTENDSFSNPEEYQNKKTPYPKKEDLRGELDNEKGD